VSRACLCEGGDTVRIVRRNGSMQDSRRRMRQDLVHACRLKSRSNQPACVATLRRFTDSHKGQFSRSTNKTTTTNGDELWEAIAVCRRKHFEDLHCRPVHDGVMTNDESQCGNGSRPKRLSLASMANLTGNFQVSTVREVLCSVPLGRCISRISDEPECEQFMVHH
jgi:hypothetical protein